MKCFSAFVLIAVLGVFTIGCETKKGASENKTIVTLTILVFKYSATSALFLATRDVRNQGGQLLAGTVPVGKKAIPRLSGRVIK